MKRSRFSEEQIIGILKEHEAGVSVADLCRKHGVSDASIYKSPRVGQNPPGMVT
jgi:putative transposase